MSEPLDLEPIQLRARLRHGAREAWRSTLGLLYPPACIACQAATGEPHTLCAACWSGVRFIERPYCERLGTPFAVDLGQPLLSPAAIADPPVFQRVRAVAEYDGTASLLVHRLKYNDRLELVRALGRMMTRAGAELLVDADVIVPVPLHRWRLWRRRFNQAMALARVVSAGSGVPCDPFLLARVKRTRRQVGLTKAQRKENLQGAFRVPVEAKARVQGKRGHGQRGLAGAPARRCGLCRHSGLRPGGEGVVTKAQSFLYPPHHRRSFDYACHHDLHEELVPLLLGRQEAS